MRAGWPVAAGSAETDCGAGDCDSENTETRETQQPPQLQTHQEARGVSPQQLHPHESVVERTHGSMRWLVEQKDGPGGTASSQGENGLEPVTSGWERGALAR